MPNDFYRTQMGHTFYEGTMPSLVRELRQINANLKQLIEAVEAMAEKLQQEKS